MEATVKYLLNNWIILLLVWNKYMLVFFFVNNVYLFSLPPSPSIYHLRFSAAHLKSNIRPVTIKININQIIINWRCNSYYICNKTFRILKYFAIWWWSSSLSMYARRGKALSITDALFILIERHGCCAWMECVQCIYMRKSCIIYIKNLAQSLFSFMMAKSLQSAITSCYIFLYQQRPRRLQIKHPYVFYIYKSSLYYFWTITLYL